MKDISLSVGLRERLIERIEDELDLAVFNRAVSEKLEDDVTCSLTEVISMLETSSNVKCD
ncbi:MAG: hypothetical protein IJG85_01400 [Eubacteriaceae bacterium]|jgi:hypothetical protein|nr:hypothetical protein [Eubacteriaceae bacterium]